MEHCTYLRKFRDGSFEKFPALMLGKPTQKYYADHVNHYGKKTSPVYIESAGYDSNWPERDFIERCVERMVMYFIVGGSGSFNDEPVGAGMAFFTIPNRPHTIIQNRNDPLRAYWITINGSYLSSFIGRCGFNSGPRAFHVENMSKIADIVYDMVYVNHNDVNLASYFTGALYNITAILQNTITQLSYDTVSEMNIHVKKCLEYIEKNFTQDITIDMIAENIHISSKRLSNIFSSCVGFTVKELITKYRVDLACSLLKHDKEYSIAEIGEIIGYSDYSYFSKVFKKQKGLSPLEYRKSHDS